MNVIVVNVEITVGASNVFNEVGRLTHYAGQKLEKQSGDFERMSATDSDKAMLLQFWQSACDTLTETFKSFIQEITVSDTEYHVKLKPSKAYDGSLTDSIQENVKSYIILHMVSRWFMLTNKEDAAAYEKDAANQLNEAVRKWYYKKKPTRTRPNN